MEETASAKGVGSKERIFRAAMSVALRKGFGNVALSLVAWEAGLSKGGRSEAYWLRSAHEMGGSIQQIGWTKRIVTNQTVFIQTTQNRDRAAI